MKYSIMGDEEILKDLARQIERLRITKQLKESDIQEISGISRKTLYNFKQGNNSISLRNFIRLLKALGELDRLQNLFSDEDAYSPMAASDKELPKRVRDKKRADREFQWGDEK